MKNYFFKFIIMGWVILFTNGCEKIKEKDPYINTNKPIFNNNLTYGIVTDIDSNTYKTIKIGNQTWLAENLKTVHYRNGDPIPNVLYVYIWDSLTTGAYCEYYSRAENSKTYGNLYNWYAVTDSRNLAPVGWHIPSKDEWDTLINYLNDKQTDGGKLKETGFTHWLNPNLEATNETGFTALPGGSRTEAGYYMNAGTFAYWWATSELIGHGGFFMSTNYEFGNFMGGFFDKRHGYSVRCIKDE
jgi:uncharacterized protein (TIGR02145 family)